MRSFWRQKKEYFRSHSGTDLIREIFFVLLAFSLLAMAMESVVPGMVLAYIDFNFILLSLVLVGIILVISEDQTNASK